MAGAGKQVGLTEAQVLGFAAALSSVGIEAQMGGSAFSKALIKMEVASATGGNALEDFGKVAGMTGQQFKALWDSDPGAQQSIRYCREPVHRRRILRVLGRDEIAEREFG